MVVGPAEARERGSARRLAMCRRRHALRQSSRWCPAPACSPNSQECLSPGSGLAWSRSGTRHPAIRRVLRHDAARALLDRDFHRVLAPRQEYWARVGRALACIFALRRSSGAPPRAEKHMRVGGVCDVLDAGTRASPGDQGAHWQVPIRTPVSRAAAPCCMRMFGVDGGDTNIAGSKRRCSIRS